MPPQPERRSAAAPAPTPALPLPRPTITGVPGGAWLRVLSVLSIGLMLALSGGLLLVQREAALDRAEGQAQREVQRLAAELEQSLRLARASMQAGAAGAQGQTAEPLAAHAPLVATLNLPFTLRRLDATSAANLSPGRWTPDGPRLAGPQWVVPLRWRAAADAQAYEMTLPREALLSRFASEGLPFGGSMTLFRLNDDDSTTILVRYPLVPHEQGLTIRSHVADALQRAPSGVFQAQARIDGVRRVVGYHRLGGDADRLVVVYALGLDDVLATWNAVLPFAVLLTLLVAAAMAYGAWRLDRSMRALARSERHFQTLSDHLPDVVVRYDAAGRVLYANPAVEAASGVKPEAMLGHTFEEFGTPPEIAGQWMACLRRAFGTGQVETLYFTYQGPQGERHWEAQASLEPVAAGETPTVLVINRDITARREAEHRQHSAQQLFEAVFQAAPEGMSLSEWGTGRLLLVNDAFCSLFGRTREQLLIGRSTLDLNLWQAPEERQQLIERLERGEQVRDAVASSTRPDGRSIHVRYSAERVQQGGEQRLLLMFRDVSQLESDQRALARSEMRFRLAAAHGQVWEWDFGRGFIQPSDEFFVALGHPSQPAEQMGERFLDLIHPEDLPRLRQVLYRFFKGEGDYRLEFRARDAQGQYRWFDTRGSGLRDASGQVTYMAGTTFEISDRKALEEAQRQTLKHLDTVANASAALSWTVDEHQRPDWFNQPWLDFTGRDLRSECEAPWLEEVHPQDRERCAQVFNSAFEAREPYSLEYRLRRHDGVYRWLHEQGRPRHDADQRFIGYVGSCLDVTELREAEANARERGAMLKQVFDVLKDMLFVLDAQERFVFFQAGAEDRLYRRPEEFLGRPLAEVMPPDMVPPLRAAMQRAREGGIQEMDYTMDLPVGTHHFNARLAWLPGGERCMFLVRDVTERQLANLERERLNRFVLLLFSLANRFINLPVHEADAAINEALGNIGEFLEADRTYLFDYDLVAETGSNTHEWCAEGITPEIANLQNLPFDLIPDWIGQHRLGRAMHVPDTQALPAGPLRELLESQGIRSLIALPLTHGERCLGFVGLDTVRSTHDYGEEETTLLLLFAQMLVNIRLRVEAQAQIRELTGGLERKVVERTAQLETSVQQLKTANSELEAFTYSASHDLRTPLRGIEGFSALLLEEHAAQLDDQGREYLQRIQRATLHMSQLVNDLLAYSHLQQLAEQIEPVGLATCVQAVAAPFRDELEARQGQLNVSVPDDLRVQANPKGLAIVLRNLIDNALKFTPGTDAPRVSVEASAVGDRVRLSVTDQGIGFDMKHHDRIFGMFQRLHRQDQIPGTGIGLALVQKAVERMGGHIRADSAPGHGATFHVDLPLA